MIRVIKLALSIGYYASKRFWALLIRMIGKKPPGTCVVLYYHSVKPEQRRRFAQQMDDLIRWTRPIRASLNEPLQNGVYYSAVTFDDGFINVIDNALPELIQRRIPSTLFITTGSLGKRPLWDIGRDNPDYEEICMTANQLRKLSSGFISIGSHTVTHPKLTRIDERMALCELSDSKKQLETILLRNVNLLSFPHGDHNDKIVKLSLRAGYKRVFTILPTFAFSKPGEYITGRVKVDPEDWRLEFRLKLLGAYCWLPFAFALKHKLLRYVRRLPGPVKTHKQVEINNEFVGPPI
jgi:peptidoglycan/xylan/chitin deacetylase (PgdA/CDA1 family)